MGHAAQHRPALVPFFPVHEEVTKSWKAHFTVRSHFAASSTLTTPDGEAAKGYTEIPQVESAIAVYLCPQSAAICQNCPHLLFKACMQFSSPVSPRFSGVLFISVENKDNPVLHVEIVVLLAKNAIEPVPPAKMKSRFYSPYIIIPKKGSGLLPICMS